MSLRYAHLGVLGTEDVLEAFRGLPWWQVLLAPALGGLVAGVIGEFLARRSGGHAIADVLEAVVLGRGDISLPAVLIKSVASLAAQVGGGSLGREGSILQFGAGAGSLVGRLMAIRGRELRALIAAGTAAGFAAAYNTPVAAVVFVLEIVTGVVTLEVLLPVVVATTLATALTRVAVGGGPFYGERAFVAAAHGELVAFAAVGVVAGALGAAFVAGLSRAERLLRRSPLPRPLRAALGGLAVGALALVWPEVTGNGYEAVNAILDGRLVGPLLVTLVVAKGLATVASVSSGSPGGVFTPSLFLGAALGGFFGGVSPWAGAPGGYALVGMAAFAAATTHAPLMAAVLVFELSGDYAIVLPLLLATGLSAFVSRALYGESVYTQELRERGIPWRGSLSERLARAVRAGELMRPDAPVLPADAPIADALAMLEADHRVVWVPGPPLRAVDLGVARPLWAASARGEPVPATVGDVAVPCRSVSPSATLLELTDAMWDAAWGELPVVDASGRLLGTVTRRDVLAAIDREVLDREVLVTRVVADAGRESAVTVALPDADDVALLPVPGRLVGADADPAAWLAEFGVYVLAVRRRTAHLGTARLIEPQGRLRARDQLLVVGTKPAIAAFVAGRAGA